MTFDTKCLLSHIISSLYTYRFAGLWTGVASQSGDADSSQAPSLTSGSWTEQGVLECPSQFNTVNHDVDALVVCNSPKITLFFIYFSESL